MRSLVLALAVVSLVRQAYAQDFPRDIGWYERLSTAFANPSLRIQLGTGRFGPVIVAVFQDSLALQRPWAVQEPLAKKVAAYIFAHADTSPRLGVVNIGYEQPRFAGQNTVRLFRYFPPFPGDTLADAIAPPGTMPPKRSSMAQPPNARDEGPSR